MANRIYISHLNPLQIVPVEPSEVPQYFSKHMDDFFLRNRLNPAQSLPREWAQQWSKSDSITLQLQTNAGVPQIQLIDCNMLPLVTLNMTAKQRNKFQPDYYIYEGTVSLASVPEGEYWILITVGNKLFISEKFQCSIITEYTLLLVYSHDSYYGNMIFETGIKPSIRIPGIISYQMPGSIDTIYEDQILDATMVQRKPFRVPKLFIEQSPDWLFDKLNWILGCRNVQIDGRYYTVAEGSKWEEDEASFENRTLIGASIELREALTRNSKVYDYETNSNELLTVQYLTDVKGFGDLSNEGSSDLITIYDWE